MYFLISGLKGLMRVFSPGGRGRGRKGGWAVLQYMGSRGCPAQQGMVFVSLSLEQGLKISVSVWNMVYFLPIPTLEHSRGRVIFFHARIALQTNNIVAVPVRVPLHVYSNTPFPIRR